MSRRTINGSAWIGALSLALSASIAVAQNQKTQGLKAADADVAQALVVLGKLNRASELEPAGSRGSIGLGMGAGMTRTTLPEQNAVLAAQLSRDELATDDSPASTVDVPRLWLVKGLPLPIDLGFSGGMQSDAGITQASGYAQWTMYEALAMPALAVRGTYGRLFGLEGLNLTSTGVEGVAGLGLLRYFTIFGRAGIFQHRGELKIDQESHLAFLLTETESNRVVAKSWSETVMGAGLRVMIYPPFVTLTGEMEWSGETKGRDFAAKLGFGM